MNKKYIIAGTAAVLIIALAIAVFYPVAEKSPTGKSVAETTDLKGFNKCLADNGMVIYGASWCGHCKQVSSLLGGHEIMGSLYVECTQNQELCSQENIRAYPTIRFNGVDYRGARTLEAFGQTAGCNVPVLE